MPVQLSFFHVLIQSVVSLFSPSPSLVAYTGDKEPPKDSSTVEATGGWVTSRSLADTANLNRPIFAMFQFFDYSKSTAKLTKFASANPWSIDHKTKVKNKAIQVI